MSEKENFFLNEEVINRQRTLSPKQVILSLLRAKAMKQTDLAREVGISKQALFNYINGKWGVPTQIKIKISQSLGVDSAVIWDFLQEKENE